MHTIHDRDEAILFGLAFTTDVIRQACVYFCILSIHFNYPFDDHKIIESKQHFVQKEAVSA